MKQHHVQSWVFIAALFALCGVLGFLQYRWTGQVSLAERDRLKGSLQATLNRLSYDFNSEVAAALRGLLPQDFPSDEAAAEAEIASGFEQRTGRPQVFEKIAIAAFRDGKPVLRVLDFRSRAFHEAEWPQDWSGIRERLEAGPRRESPGEEGRRMQAEEEDGCLFEFPLFSGPRMDFPPRAFFAPRSVPRLIVQLALPYLRDMLLPEAIQRHLGAGDYQVAVYARGNPAPVYQSQQSVPADIQAAADASVPLLDVREVMRRRRMRGTEGPRPFDPGATPGRGPGPGFGRWTMFVRHRAGSLDTVVAQARWRNLAVSGGVLLLILASGAALIRFTRRAQRLAQLQMDFIAGVSHELRTPLTVIHTAAYNLRGKLAGNPGQVERYGALIQQESGRLKEMVEQVLRFAGAEAGRTIAKREPVRVDEIVEAGLEACKPALQAAGCDVEKAIEPDLPPVLGDGMALQQAVQNLLSNAAKYGAEGESKWVGVAASRVDDGRAVEIRVSDRGPGIPKDEREQVFDPFFRGRQATEGQMHGAGLGLNLVKKIAEAHGGTVRVESEPGKGARFVLRIPAAPGEGQDA